MLDWKEARIRMESGSMDEKIRGVYGCEEEGSELAQYKKRYLYIMDRFAEQFGEADRIALFSAPGRTELGGNHTDHQHGNVLAASVNLDIISCAAEDDSRKIRILSEGYPMDEVDISDLSVHPEEVNKTAALIRGMAAAVKEKGYEVKGFHAYMTSNVLSGSGLSSSAAYETMIGIMLNQFFCGGALTPVEIAQMGQYAENKFFGKPCGLMDQMASSVGGVVAIDFEDNANPKVCKIPFDMKQHGFALCIIDTGADHAELTGDYAAIPAEMKQIAKALGKEVLRETDEAEFVRRIPELRKEFGDRSVLRAMHFYEENRRAVKEKEAFLNGEFQRFLKLAEQSGKSSAMYLQNVYTGVNPKIQDMTVALALADRLLQNDGAVRVHGGGFAGTIQAFVPIKDVPYFKTSMEAVLGSGSCHILNIRPAGGVVVMS